MDYKEQYKLKTNPFRITPSINSEEVVWAGFPDLKQQLVERIKYSLQIPNSSLVLNWGEYGSGKTHSALYFSNETILAKIAKESKKPSPFPINLLLPKGKSPVHDFFISIIDGIKMEPLRQKFKDDLEGLKDFIKLNSSNEQLNNIIFQIFNSEIEIGYLKQYLYGTLSKSDLKRDLEEYGIFRFLGKSDDYVKFISLFFLCLTYNQKHYSSVIFWIDEFEDIQTLTSSSRDDVNNFLRELINNTPNYLLLFLNFTLSPIDSVEDISKHLSSAVLDRVRKKIEFKQPTLEELKLYINDLLNNCGFRTDTTDDLYYPFTEEGIEFVEEKLGMVSLRRYNETFSILLDIANNKKVERIDKDFIEEYESEWIGWS